MEFDLVLRKRRNVYGFQDRPIPEVVLSRILENARHVPSPGFTQDFDLVVVRDPEKREKLAEAARQHEYASYGGVVAEFIEKAPVVVVPCGNKSRFESKYGSPAEKNARIPWWLTDSAFSSLALILSAVQEGLAASFIGAIDDIMVVNTIKLPIDGSIIPLAIVPIGYRHPQERRFGQEMRKRVKALRRSTNQIHWDEWVGRKHRSWGPEESEKQKPDVYCDRVSRTWNAKFS